MGRVVVSAWAARVRAEQRTPDQQRASAMPVDRAAGPGPEQDCAEAERADGDADPELGRTQWSLCEERVTGIDNPAAAKYASSQRASWTKAG